MKNLLIEKWANGGKVVGTFFNCGSELAMDAIGVSGLDFVILEQEHAPMSEETVCNCARAAELRGMTPICRIKEISRSSVTKVLDSGLHGFICPAIADIDAVKTLIEYCKYPPTGNRGMAMGRGADFGYGPFAHDLELHLKHHNKNVLFFPMCETKKFFEQIEEIVALEGVDGIFVGPMDLSIALGKPGEFGDPEIQAAYQKVADTCKRVGKHALIYAPTAEAAKDYFARGFDGVAVELDVQVLIAGYRRILEEING